MEIMDPQGGQCWQVARGRQLNYFLEVLSLTNGDFDVILLDMFGGVIWPCLVP